MAIEREKLNKESLGRAKISEDYHRQLNAARVRDGKREMRQAANVLSVEPQNEQREIDHARTSSRRRNAKMLGESFSRVAKGPKAKAPVEAIRLGLKLRKQIKEGDDSALDVAYFVAAMIDFVDMIPVAGWLVTLFCRPLLFVMLWGYGKWKVKLVMSTIIFFDFLPLIHYLPLSLVSVAYVHHVIKKRRKEAERKLEKLEKRLQEG